MEENIKKTFHLPISYQETTKINDNIKSDLELLKTKDEETKSAYNYHRKKIYKKYIKNRC